MRITTAYLLFVALFDFGMSLIFVPYVPFLMSIGLTLSEVSLVNAWFIGAALFAEIPTGMFADRMGRARAIRLGAACTAIASFLYATASGFATALLYEVMIGIGLAFMNGALGAWVKDTLAERGEDDRYARVVATTSLVRAAVVICGGLVGWQIALRAGYRTGWILSGACISASVAWSLRCMPTDAPRPRPKKRNALSESVRAMRSRPGLLWAVAAALAFNLVVPFNHFWPPFLTTRAGEEALGWGWVAIQLPLVASSQMVRRCGEKYGAGARMISGSLILAGIGLMGASRTAGIAVPLLFVILHEGARGFYIPLIEIFTQRHVEAEYRATYMSLQSFFARIGGTVVLFSVWIGTKRLPSDEATICLVWSVAGAALIVFALLLWALRPRT